MREALILQKGRVMDPASQTDEVMDVLIAEGVIQKMGHDIKMPGARVIPLEGKMVTPGLIDLHTHLREPGGEAHETIRSGAMAAAARALWPNLFRDKKYLYAAYSIAETFAGAKPPP